MFDDWYWLPGMVCNLSMRWVMIIDMDALDAFEWWDELSDYDIDYPLMIRLIIYCDELSICVYIDNWIVLNFNTAWT